MFFFHSSADHRYLHSFPTRRSSDLRINVADNFLQRITPQLAEEVAPFEAAQVSFSCQRDVLLQEALRSPKVARSEEHTSELQSRRDLVCRLLLEKKKKKQESMK